MITNQLSFIFTPLWPTCGRRRRRLPEAQPQVCCGLHLTKLAHGLWSRLSCYHILSDPHWLSWMFYIKKKKNESSCFNPVDFCTFVQICFGVVCCFLLLLLYSYDQFWNDAVSGLPVFQPFFFSPVWFFSPQKNESSYSSQNIRRILWSLLLNSWTHLCGIKPSVKRRFVYWKY